MCKTERFLTFAPFLAVSYQHPAYFYSESGFYISPKSVHINEYMHTAHCTVTGYQSIDKSRSSLSAANSKVVRFLDAKEC
jgi:hypothetical protein